MAYITYEDDDGKAKTQRLRPDARTAIGRSGECEICLDGDHNVSRAHCAVYYYPEAEAFALSDLGSTNGTLLNGLKISSDVLLSDGDEIEVGGRRLKFHSNEQLAKPSHEVKTAEPVKAFGLAESPLTDHTQSVRRSADEDFNPNAAVFHQQVSPLHAGGALFHEGDMIGESRVLRLLSDTDAASVFVVQAPEGSDEPEAALKVFKGQVGDKAQQDFLDLIQAVAKIQHPGFIRYLEAGSQDGRCYYVAEYLDRLNLAKRISQKAPFHEVECLALARQVGAALAYSLSEHRIFHRNLKPSNILFRKDGSPAVADYGLATWESVNLADCVSIASPWYISPEQILGKRIGWSCDLYSLGIILFQTLTGVLPFHSIEEEELLGLHLEAPFPSPEERNPNVRISEETVKLLKKMTEKNPDDRYEDWAAFLQAVDGSLALLRASAARAKPFRPEKSNAAQAPTLGVVARTGTVKRGKIAFEEN